MKKKYTLSLIIAIAVAISAVVLSSAAIISLSANADTKTVSVRSGITEGLIAVAEYNSTDGIKISAGTSFWAQNTSSYSPETELEFGEYDSANEYLRQGEDDRIYMSGTYDNSALVFYVKESENDEHKLRIGIENIDEAMFFAGIESQSYSKVRLSIYHNSEYKWENLQSDNASEPITINYKNCFYDAEKDAYQVVIRVDNGMAAFSVLKLTGLEILNIEGDSSSLYYRDGILMKADGKTANAAQYANFTEIEELMQACAVLPSEAYINLLKAFLQSVAEQMQAIIDTLRLIYGQG